MGRKSPTNDSAELFRRINRLGAEAEWTTDELREALREEGIDPDRLVNNTRGKIDQLLKKERAVDAQGADASAAPASLLAKLREHTRLPATKIALEMEVPVPFLAAIGRYPKAVPISWRKELDARAECKLGTDRGVVLNAFEHPNQAQMAA